MKAKIEIVDERTGTTQVFNAENAIVLNREDGFFVGNFKKFSDIREMFGGESRTITITLIEDWDGQDLTEINDFVDREKASDRYEIIGPASDNH